VSIEEIRDFEGNLLCVHSQSLVGEKIVDFWNLENASLEIGLMHRGPNDPVKLHRHTTRKSDVLRRTNEVLIQLDGQMRISVFTDDGSLVRELTSSDMSITLFIQGAHKIDFVELTNIIEIKNGPFQGLSDKIWMDEVL
jgi:hypothetical protein